MRPRDSKRAKQLDQALADFDANVRALPGIATAQARACLIDQILESIRRVRFVHTIRGRDISRRRADPLDDMFDPVRAAVLHQLAGRTDEAFWLVFLFVHFGKHTPDGWRYLREVYGGGQTGAWTWARVSADVAAFRADLNNRALHIRRKDVPGGFGGHRRYESLDAYSAHGTGAVVASYVAWVASGGGGHEQLFAAAQKGGNDPHQAFEDLYCSLDAVTRFGRTARFDYLAMIGKLGLANIEPGSPYLNGATGPLRGARLLLDGNKHATEGVPSLEDSLKKWGSRLDIGMQVVEDSLCNWQKSPSEFKAFRG